MIGETAQSARPTVEDVARTVMTWASGRVPTATAARVDGDSEIVVKETGARFETSYLEREEPVWGARLVHRDTSDEYVRWICDVTVLGMDFARAFTCAVSVGSNDGVYLPLRRARSRPRVVKEIVDKWGARRHYALRSTATISMRHDVGELVEMLRDLKRARPIVVVGGAAHHLAGSLAERLVGIAHVHVIGELAAQDELAEAMPTDLDCRKGEVRVYWPRLLDGSRSNHRLWTRRDVDDVGDRLPEHVLAYISEASVYSTDPDETTWADLEAARRSLAMGKLRDQGDIDELVRLVDEENDGAKRRIASLETEVQELKEELETARVAESYWRHEYIDLSAKGAQHATAATEAAKPPATVREALERAIAEHPERLALALNGKSDIDTPFAEAEEVLGAMRFLATTYHAAKTGVDACSDFNEPLRKTVGWFYRGTQSKVTMGKYEDWYVTTYDGHKLSLGQHVGTGNSKDPRHSIRIAFAWHAESKRVVIGFVGQHQETDQT